MPIDLSKIQALINRDLAGETIACCEYLKVTWDDSTTAYYGSSAWHQITPFNNIGFVIEPVIIPKNKKDPFHEMELCPDLRTDSIKIKFDNIGDTANPQPFTRLFNTYRSGVSCEFILYYPAEDYHHPLWLGQLQAPQVFGWKTVEAVATNGFRSRELIIPGRNYRKECGASIFGGKLADTDAVRSSICPYDKHLGGSIGKLNPSTAQPYEDCPKTREACIARLDMNNDGRPEYFPGFILDTGTISQPYQGHPFLANSRGNASNTKESVYVVAGTKTVRNPLIIQYAIISPPFVQDQALVKLIYSLGEGPVQNIGSVTCNDFNVVPPHIERNVGNLAQGRFGYSPNVTNFSGTAMTYFVYGGPNFGLDSSNFSPSNLTVTAQVQGFKEVCVYTDSVTKTRQYSINRVWWLLELYKNQRFGMGYIESLFEISDWIDVADWTADAVTHTVLFPDGEELVTSSTRSTFNCIIEGKPVGEQVEDICRSGAISVPFQYEGKFTIAKFGLATAGELSSAVEFYDSGETKNIIWDEGQPSITLSQIPDNKVVNEVELRFEESANGDIERPLTIDDPNQKLLAGRQQGPDYFLTVPKKYTGYGITYFAEAARVGYRLLRYGEFDSGGTDNNLKLTFTVPLEYALLIRRYDIIKVVSDLLDEFDLPSGSVDDVTRYPVEYFRVLKIQRTSNAKAEITAQVYNHTSYTNFEVGGGGSGPTVDLTVLGAGVSAANGAYGYTDDVNGKRQYAKGNWFIYWTGAEWRLLDYSNLTSPVYRGSGGAEPWDATWTSFNTSFNPAPTVVEGMPPIPRTAAITVTAHYNPEDSVIEVMT
jgi:hypothetical protein